MNIDYLITNTDAGRGVCLQGFEALIDCFRLTAERIAAVIACTAFDAGPNRSPFVVELDVGVAEMQPDETPAALLERASAHVS